MSYKMRGGKILIDSVTGLVKCTCCVVTAVCHACGECCYSENSRYQWDKPTLPTTGGSITAQGAAAAGVFNAMTVDAPWLLTFGGFTSWYQESAPFTVAGQVWKLVFDLRMNCGTSSAEINVTVESVPGGTLYFLMRATAGAVFGTGSRTCCTANFVGWFGSEALQIGIADDATTAHTSTITNNNCCKRPVEGGEEGETECINGTADCTTGDCEEPP